MSCCRAIVVVALAILLPGCGKTPAAPAGAGKSDGPPLFREITNQIGLTFRHHVTVGGEFHLPEIMGAGVAVFDANGDGKLDLFFVDSGETKGKGAPDRLWLRQPDGRYRDATDGAGLDQTGYGTGVAAGDVDNDGDIDLYVGNWGSDALYLNDGAGKFTDVTERAGIKGDHWTASVGFVDYDLDGWLDIYVCHYVRFDPTRSLLADERPPRLLRPGILRRRFRHALSQPRRRHVRRRLASHRHRLRRAQRARRPLRGFQRRRPSRHLRRERRPRERPLDLPPGRTLLDEALAMGIALSGAAAAQASMGVTMADVEADGDLDLFITNIVNQSNILYLRDGATHFRDATAASALAAPSRPHTGFGAVFFDADHDGDADLAVANGRVARGEVVPGAALDAHWNEYAERNQVFLNDGRGVFTEGAAGDFAAHVELGRALAAADLDGDGDLDLVLTGVGTPARVFENVGARGHWLAVRARDERLKRDAFGARVIVHAGGRKQERTVSSAISYFTSCVAPVHFGLAGAAAVDRIEVVWPGGDVESFPGGPADREVVLVRGQGSSEAPARGPGPRARRCGGARSGLRQLRRRREARPPALEGMEPAVVAKIKDAHARVVADPTPASWARYARILHAHDLIREAVGPYVVAAARTEMPEKFELLYLAGHCAMKPDPDRAKQLFEEAAALRDDYGPLHLRLGALDESAGRWDDAARRYERAEPLQARDQKPGSDALAGLGRARLAQGRVPDAIAALEKARAIDPDNSEVHATLAAAYARAGRKAEAARRARAAGNVQDPHGFPDPIATAMRQEGVSYQSLMGFGNAALRGGVLRPGARGGRARARGASDERRRAAAQGPGALRPQTVRGGRAAPRSRARGEAGQRGRPRVQGRVRDGPPGLRARGRLLLPRPRSGPSRHQRALEPRPRAAGALTPGGGQAALHGRPRDQAVPVGRPARARVDPRGRRAEARGARRGRDRARARAREHQGAGDAGATRAVARTAARVGSAP